MLLVPLDGQFKVASLCMMYLTYQIYSRYLKRYANSNGPSLAIKLCIVMNIDIAIVILEPQLF